MGQIETRLGIAENTTRQNVENMRNSDIHIGYNIRKNGSYLVIPVFESPNATNIFNNGDPGYDCIIIRQLQFLRNITKINIMNVADNMFIFDNVELNELYSISGKGRRSRGNEENIIC
jgi:hypothetical protein